jgi:hypothetical protein
MNKSWFAVRKRGAEDQLLTLVPQSTRCVFPFNAAAKKHIRSLLAGMQHPYLQPITDLDFLTQQVGLRARLGATAHGPRSLLRGNTHTAGSAFRASSS